MPGFQPPPPDVRAKREARRARKRGTWANVEELPIDLNAPVPPPMPPRRDEVPVFTREMAIEMIQAAIQQAETRGPATEATTPPDPVAKRRGRRGEIPGWGGPARGSGSRALQKVPDAEMSRRGVAARKARDPELAREASEKGISYAEYVKLKTDEARIAMLKARMAWFAHNGRSEGLRYAATERLLSRLEGLPVAKTQQLGADGRPVDPADQRPVFVVQIRG